MDGIHDLGGMDGVGPITRDADESVFHADWERRVFGLQLATRAYNADEFRHAIERMEPASYLESSYFERWLVALETLLTEKGVLSPGELHERVAELGTAEAFDDGMPIRRDLEATAAFMAAIERGGSRRADPAEPQFAPGDTVVVKNRHPPGHTRCPGYVRRSEGTVDRVDGTFPVPDANAHGEAADPEPVYHVRFDAAELWDGAADDNAAVYVDLWERYLEAP